MNPVLTSTFVGGLLVVAALCGRVVRRRLPAHHLSLDSKEAMKLAMGLVATMTALLLGLLVSSAKNTYDSQRSEVIAIAGKIAFVDRLLILYGPEAESARAQFHLAVQDAVHRMWPKESDRPARMAPNMAAGGVVYSEFQRLSPQNEVQRGLKAQAVSLVTDLGQIRTLLLAQSVPSVAPLLLLMVVVWLAIIFFTFSLLTPPNATATLSLMVSAFAVAGAILLILELDRPFGGIIRISPEPMLNALEEPGK